MPKKIVRGDGDRSTEPRPTAAVPEATAPTPRRSRAGQASPAPTKRATTRRTTAGTRPKPVAVAADSGLTAGALAATATPIAPAEPTHGEIATRAYFIHLRRQGVPGSPSDDWMAALAELRRERALL